MRSLLLALAVAALFVTGCRHREADADAAVVARWRFRGVEALAQAAGIEPAAAGLDQLESWWQAVKREEAK